MKKRRKVILLGAGATVPWGGKTSIEITSPVLNTPLWHLKTAITDECWGLYLQKILAQYYNIEQKYITFEQVLDATEYLWSYFYHKDLPNPPEYRILLPAFFEIKREIDEQIKVDNQIFGAKPDDTETTLKSLVFANLIKEIQENICHEVNRYTSNFDTLDFKEKSKNLVKFITSLPQKLIRIYSLNYDDILNKIPELPSFFNGFEKTSSILKLNYQKVLQNTEENIFYNLHGSFYFDEYFNPESLKLEWIYNPKYAINRSITMSSRFLPKTVYPSQIVTGSHKVEKTSAEPLKAFNCAFDYDCILTKVIVLIGYSFGDIHINSTLNSALNADRGKKIIILTYIESYQGLFEFKNKMHNAFPVMSNEIESIEYQDSNWIFSKNKNIIINIRGFLHSSTLKLTQLFD